MFAGNKEAGEDLAALYTVVATTCVANEVDPLASLTAILTGLDSTSVESSIDL